MSKKQRVDRQFIKMKKPVRPRAAATKPIINRESVPVDIVLEQFGAGVSSPCLLVPVDRLEKQEPDGTVKTIVAMRVDLLGGGPLLITDDAGNKHAVVITSTEVVMGRRPLISGPGGLMIANAGGSVRGNR